MTPAPITIISSGTFFRDRAPVEDTMLSSSIYKWNTGLKRLYENYFQFDHLYHDKSHTCILINECVNEVLFNHLDNFGVSQFCRYWLSSLPSLKYNGNRCLTCPMWYADVCSARNYKNKTHCRWEKTSQLVSMRTQGEPEQPHNQQDSRKQVEMSPLKYIIPLLIYISFGLDFNQKTICITKCQQVANPETFMTNSWCVSCSAVSWIFRIHPVIVFIKLKISQNICRSFRDVLQFF